MACNLGACAGRDFHRGRCGPHPEDSVDSEHRADFDRLSVDFVGAKALLDEADVIRSRRRGRLSPLDRLPSSLPKSGIDQPGIQRKMRTTGPVSYLLPLRRTRTLV